MRLVSFRGEGGAVRSGILDGDAVIDLAAAAPLVLADADTLRWDMLSLLRADQDGVSPSGAEEILTAVRESFALIGMSDAELAYAGGFIDSGHSLVLPLAQVTLLPPLPVAASLREYDAVAAYGPLPSFRFANHQALLGAQQALFAPAAGLSAMPSIGLVIGRGGRSIEREDALEHITGLVLLNNWQRLPPSPRRPRDLATSCGPWLATLDEFEIYRDDDGLYSLDVTLWADDQLRARANARVAGFDPALMLADASLDVDLLPGDLISWPLLPALDQDAENAGVGFTWGTTVIVRATGLGSIETTLD
jgi:fumarylacetoacetate (FAA) hydrolase